ncbi:MAG: tetratricopeptide repeat protein [Gammaproteobacteria bacterium]|nr:tetratricopeptide repeat protein [Gammaproteobacteria bacterium]MBK9428364.1 tetratricopeptide repeat protein [Gammaproteobacteria bacterium]
MFRLFYGAALNQDGRPEAGITQLDMCLRLSPKDPNAGLVNFYSCFSHLALGDFPQAEQAARKTVKLMPDYGMGYVMLAISLAALGRDAEAQQQLRMARQVTPTRTRQMLEDFWRLIFQKPEDAEKLIALLRQTWRD